MTANRLTTLLGLLISVSVTTASAQGVSTRDLDCGYLFPDEVRAAIADATLRGEIEDPATRFLPTVSSTQDRFGPGAAETVSPSDLFLYEDSAGLLLTDFSNGELFDLMFEAANTLMVEHGDNFDFIGYWVNFTPDHQLGSAFYLGIENDVSGIGSSQYQDRANFGITGDNLEGVVMMWNEENWTSGASDLAAYTQLVLGQEFEHRFGMFLSGISGGRSLQGTSGCGRGAHWNWKVDGQGDGMEVREWSGSSPAVLDMALCVDFAPDECYNTDIGGVFCYADLYLMGYVSPTEMDSGFSEFRYMNNGCNSPYNGPITTFGSAEIIASNGARVPNANDAQKDFRTAWIMIHQPGSPPEAGELDNVVDILNQWTLQWPLATLGLGVMDNTLGLVGVDAPLRDPAASITVSHRSVPNPFREETLISYEIPRAADVSLRIHDVSGRVVRVLENAPKEAGKHRVSWDARDGAARPVAPGVYFYRLTVDGAAISGKTIVIR